MLSPLKKKSRIDKKQIQETEMTELNQIPRSKTLTVNLKQPKNLNNQDKTKSRKPSYAVQEDDNSIHPDMLKSTMMGQSINYGQCDSILYKKTTTESFEQFGKFKQNQCESCHFIGQPKVVYENGQTTYFWCIGLSPILLFWIPFLVKGCKNKKTVCSSCEVQIDYYQPRCL